jgi:FkbM family methyltransferase
MSNFFDKALHYLGKQPQQVTALNIGAMDGVMFDEMIGYTSMYKFKVLYVEPVPYLFERLKQNITDADALFENSAISDYYGEIQMMTIDKDVIDQGLVHSCFYGMSAVFPPKNGLGSEFDRPTVEKYGKLVQVPCIPFDFLMFKHNLSAVDVIKVDAEGHDYRIFKQIDLKKYSPKVIRLEWINLTEEEQSSITTKLQEHNYVYEISGQDICAITTDLHNILYGIQEQPNTSSGVTIVTGIWNIKRDTLAEGWSRSFDHYLSHLDKLLKAPNNAIVFVQAEYVDWVWQRREKHNTLVVVKELDWFKSNESIYNKIQEIRKDAKWQNQSGWLPESTQARLEWYNPIVMSKMFLLNDAAIMDPFNSTHLVWVDGALTNTVHEGYFWHDKVVNKLEKYFNKFSFVAFPYDGKVEIHGFTYDAMCRYATGEVDKVCRGGIFGGPKDFISKANEIYYSLLAETLANGYMGTEESIFTLMLYKHPELFQYFAIEANGLLSTFFENLKND